MKKAILLTIIATLVFSPLAHAKKLEEVRSSDIVSAVETVFATAGMLAANGIKYTFKLLAQPFYWGEKLKEVKGN